MRSAEPKPQVSAMASVGRLVCSSLQRADATRACSTNFAGVTPVSDRKSRAKLRGLMASRLARVAMSSCSAGWASIQVWRLSDIVADFRFGVEEGTELGLPTRPAQEDHHGARHEHGNVTAKILLDQCQRKIDA